MYRVLLNRLRIVGPLTHLNPITRPTSNNTSALFISSFSRLNFSSKTSPPNNNSSNVVSSKNPESSSSLDDSSTDDVSTPELKRRIERYMKGDMEELDFIFEAILARKLSGKHEETDDELMEELRSNTQQEQDQQFQTDEDSTESYEDSMETDDDFTESDKDSASPHSLMWIESDEDSTSDSE